MTPRYPKLVRDKIPDILKSKGLDPKWKTVADDELAKALGEKLVEEAQEFSLDGSIEELADVLEVVTAIVARNGWSMAQLLAEMDRKTQERGAFEGGVVLTEDPNVEGLKDV